MWIEILVMLYNEHPLRLDIVCPVIALSLPTLVSASTGGDISSQGRREKRYLQTNHSPVSQTSISWSQLHLFTLLSVLLGRKALGWSQFKTTGLDMHTQTHTPE